MLGYYSFNQRMSASRRRNSGFTIVELLIVIVIIGILSALVITTYNGIQERARAAAISDYFKKADKAFRLLAAEEERATWWIDTELTGTGNPPIPSIIASTNLKNYLKAPSVTGIPPNNWIYDNEGDTLAACGTGTNGAALLINYVNTSVATSVDNALDDGDLNCGNVRQAGPWLMYVLGYTQAVD